MWPRSSFSFEFTHKLKTKWFPVTLYISDIFFALSRSSLIGKVQIKHKIVNMQFALVWRLLINEQNQLNLASAHYLYVYHDSMSRLPTRDETVKTTWNFMYRVANKKWDRKTTWNFMYRVANKRWDCKDDLKLYVQCCQHKMRP